MSKLGDRWLDTKEALQDRWEDGGVLRKFLFWLVIIYVLVALVLGVYWSCEPDVFSVREKTQQRAQHMSVEPVVGFATTATLIDITQTLLQKPGGFITNDVFLPGLFMDNMPNWEYGVLIQVRDFTRALRKDFSRSQSQSTEDKDLSLAEPRIHFNNKSWILPSSESEYRQSIAAMKNYLKRLSDPNQQQAQFYARSDNLRQWLFDVETRLGSLSQRLSASVGRPRLNTDLSGEAEARQSTAASEEQEVKTPWSEIDDVFYEARGTAWALVHLLKAIQIDFHEILVKKNALVGLRQIIRELEATQTTLYSPMVLNGGGFGLFANHSLVMASYISRANASILDLRELLSKG